MSHMSTTEPIRDEEVVQMKTIAPIRYEIVIHMIIAPISGETVSLQVWKTI